MTKKILIVGHRANLVGGAEDDLERILKYLNKEALFDIDLLIPEGPRLKEYGKYVNKIINFRLGFLPCFTSLGIDYFKYLIKGIIQCWQIFCKVKLREYEICFVNVSALIIPSIYIKLLNRKIKVVFVIREMIKPDKLRNFIFKIINRVSSGVVFVSEGIKTQFCEVTHRNENMLTIFSASEPPDYFNSPGIKESVANFLIQNDLHHSFNILNIGPISPVKNQKLILEAMSKLIANGTKINPVFIHIGDYDPDYYYVKEFFDIVNELGLKNQCYFLGVLEKEFTHEYIKKSNTVVVSSLTEGFPLVVSEAFMHKSFFITTDCVSNESILKDHFNCLIVKKDPNALKDALLFANTEADKKKEIIENAYKTYTKYLNLDKNMHNLSVFLNKI